MPVKYTCAKMKTGVCLLLLILMSGLCHCQDENNDKCVLESNVRDQYFPDITKLTSAGAYQMAVEYTMINEGETRYYIDYYEVTAKTGRVDILQDGKTTKYYYYTDRFEAFEISETDGTCYRHSVNSTPEFMGNFMYDWNYNYDNETKPFVHGPSAMFKIAYEADQANHKNVVFMGNSEKDIRGIQAQYWRRCLRENLTADYFFSVGSREGIYGVTDLKLIPLRVRIYGVDDEATDISKEILPQNYEIMSYTPFLDDPYYTFELPVGLGCPRRPQEDDNEIPSFERSNLFIYAEAIYTDYNENGGTSYTNDFMFAYDISANFLSYYTTPWIKKDGKIIAGDPIWVVYDVQKRYLYRTTYTDGQCTISNSNRYEPSLYLPGEDKGYISLTDSSIFYPREVFYYLGEGKDRGYKVDMYEVGYIDGYLLGDRLVKNTVVTHYYLKKSEIKRGPFPVEQALTRIRLSFNGTDDNGTMMNSVLNINLFGFSTQIDDKFGIFDIRSCFRNDDDYMFITIGFIAEESQLDLINEDILDVQENARTFLTEITDLPPARVPTVLVDFGSALYVTFYILERPPFQLDFDIPKEDTYISGATQSQGITTLQDCAYLCLENDLDCWGFAHCGAVCYIGAGNRAKSKLENKSKCQYYNRTSFFEVPRLKVVRTNLEHSVARGEPKITVKTKTGGALTFKPNYIGDAVFGESVELFELMGFETNPRLRVVKVGAKLSTDSGEKVGRNFGRLTYGECQRMCLDYRFCDTVSYCVSNSECILSRTHGEDIPAANIVSDSYCNVLSRKYSDKFVRSPGNVLSRSARKTVNAPKEEDCAKACEKETSFTCLSFDHCPGSKDQTGCRLHDVHILDLKNNESAVSKDSVCGHYSRKYSYDYKLESKKKTVGHGVLVSTDITLEECAKRCEEFQDAPCYGFDVCQNNVLSSTSCTVLTLRPNETKTANSDICNHYTRPRPGRFIARRKTPENKNYTNATAGGVGFLVFVIACFVGCGIVYGVAYFRVNKRS